MSIFLLTITQGVLQSGLATCLRSFGNVTPVTIFGSHRQALWFGIHQLLIAHTVTAKGKNRGRGVERDKLENCKDTAPREPKYYLEATAISFSKISFPSDASPFNCTDVPLSSFSTCHLWVVPAKPLRTFSSTQKLGPLEDTFGHSRETWQQDSSVEHASHVLDSSYANRPYERVFLLNFVKVSALLADKLFQCCSNEGAL